MAEFKIDGRMTVRTLKESFKNEFEGTLRVYNGREKADDNVTLATIRKVDDVKSGDYVCRASRTVGKFEEEMMEVFGIKVQVASPDDWVLALDGITLANLKNIKPKATKADMEELVAYKRKVKPEGDMVAETGTTVTDSSESKIKLDYIHTSRPVFDFHFKKIDWELNEENLEKHRDSENNESEYIDFFGAVMVRATDDFGDFNTKLYADGDIVDMLYNAMEDKNEYLEEGWQTVDVYYTTVCECYGAGKSYEHGQDFGYVLSSLLGCDDNDYSFDMDCEVICRAVWEDATQTWITNDWGEWDDDINLDFDALVEYKKDPEASAGKIEVKMPKMQCLNTNNKPLFEFEATSVEGEAGNGFIEIELAGKYGFINEKGEKVTPCKYGHAGRFSSNGLANVEIDGKYGFINEKGEEVIPCRYDNASSFYNGCFAWVKIDGKYGFINEKGEVVIPCQYVSVDTFSSNGLAKVKTDGKWGFINEKGEVVIPCCYDFAYRFSSNGLVKVIIDGKYGFINEKGEEVIPCQYNVDKNDYDEGFSSNGLAKVKTDGKCGFINEKGEEVIPCRFDKADSFLSNGLAVVKINGKYGLINEKGEQVTPCQYDIINNFYEGLSIVKIDDMRGFINEKGEEVIPCRYDDADNFGGGFSRVKIDDKYGVINNKGEVVIPIEYSELTLDNSGLIFVKK